jgi:hypothetical protein
MLILSAVSILAVTLVVFFGKDSVAECRLIAMVSSITAIILTIMFIMLQQQNADVMTVLKSLTI